MGHYKIDYFEKAIQDIKKHRKSGDKASIKKIEKILQELEIHPYTGIGNPEQLKHELTGYWSRRINAKDRIIYTVEENIVTVVVVSAMGHYGKK